MKFIALFVAVFLTGYTQIQTSASPKQNQKLDKSFTQWCEEKSTLPKDTRYTVGVLLKEAGTQDCSEANQKLRGLTELDLSSVGISDVKPLTSLTNLTELKLNKNKINDIKPLSNLTNLTKLSINKKQVADIKPLSELNNLTLLNLTKNKIARVQPLSELTNLGSLSLDGNQIEDIKPLSNLTNLTLLELQQNPIKNKTCPVQPKSVCKF